jgi:TRAP-type mannitol/chloroaromatic compound transport system permease small subunit
VVKPASGAAEKSESGAALGHGGGGGGQPGPGQRAVRQVEALIDLMGQATLWITLIMIGLVATNVLLRYAFSFGSVWAQELEWHLLAAAILFGMSYSLQRGDNVRVDVFYANFTPRAKFWVNVLSLVLLLLVALAFLKLSLPYVAQSLSIGESSADPGGIPLRWVVKALIPLGFALLALQTLAAGARLVLQERERTRQEPRHV